MIKDGETGLNNCSDLKTFYGPMSRVLTCLSVSSDWVPAAMRSHHICFQVIHTGTFSAGWDGLLIYKASPLSLAFSTDHIHS